MPFVHFAQRAVQFPHPSIGRREDRDSLRLAKKDHRRTVLIDVVEMRRFRTQIARTRFAPRN
jgi:hypothetical protein